MRGYSSGTNKELSGMAVSSGTTEDVSGTIGDSSGMNMPGALVSLSGTSSSGMNMLGVSITLQKLRRTQERIAKGGWMEKYENGEPTR